MKGTTSTRRAVLQLAFHGATTFVLAIMMPAVALADVTVTPAAKGYDIDVTENASSSELLDAITDTTGAIIKGQPEEITLSANHLKGASLERAIRMFIPGANFVVRFGPDDTPAQIIFLSASPGGNNNDDSSESGNGDATTPDVQDPSTDGGDTQGSGSDDDQSSQ